MYHEGNFTTLVVANGSKITKNQIFGRLKTIAKTNSEIKNLVSAQLYEACSVRAYVYKSEDIENKLEVLNKKFIRDKSNFIEVSLIK